MTETWKAKWEKVSEASAIALNALAQMANIGMITDEEFKDYTLKVGRRYSRWLKINFTEEEWTQYFEFYKKQLFEIQV